MSEDKRTFEEIAKYKANLVRAREKILPQIRAVNGPTLASKGLTFKDDGKFTNHYQLAEIMIGGADLIRRLIEDLVIEEIADILSKKTNDAQKKLEINELRTKRKPYLDIEEKQPAFCIDSKTVEQLNLKSIKDTTKNSKKISELYDKPRKIEEVQRCLNDTIKPLILAEAQKRGLTGPQAELLVTEYFFMLSSNNTIITNKLIEGDDIIAPLAELVNAKYAESEKLLAEGWVKAADLCKKFGVQSQALNNDILKMLKKASEEGKDPDLLAKMCCIRGTKSTVAYLISQSGQEELTATRDRISKKGSAPRESARINKSNEVEATR